MMIHSSPISSYAGASFAVPQRSLIVMFSVRLNWIACFHKFAAATLSQNSRGVFTLQSGLIFHIWCAGCGRSVKPGFLLRGCVFGSSAEVVNFNVQCASKLDRVFPHLCGCGAFSKFTRYFYIAIWIDCPYLVCGLRALSLGFFERNLKFARAGH